MCITDIATSIFQDLGEPDGISIPSISYWLRNAVKNGKLSNALLDDYYLIDGEISPSMESGGEDILKLLYKVYYVERILLNNLTEATLSSIQSVKEGNRQITKFNKNEIAKTYKQLLDTVREDLRSAKLAYQNKRISDEQIAVANPNNTWCPTHSCYSCSCYLRGYC